MGHRVLVVDDRGRRRVVAELFHPRPGGPENTGGAGDLIVVEVEPPCAQGMDQDLAERKR